MLGTVARDAVKRYLRNPTGPLFNDDERGRLADALAATNATAELLGRSRIRLRMGQAQRHHEAFAEGFCDHGANEGKPGPCPAESGSRKPAAVLGRRTRDYVGAQNRIHGREVFTSSRPDAPEFHDPFRVGIEGELTKAASRLRAHKGEPPPTLVYQPGLRRTDLVMGGLYETVRAVATVEPVEGGILVTGSGSGHGRPQVIRPGDDAATRALKVRYAAGLKVTPEEKGRARAWAREALAARRASKFAEARRFSERPTDFSCFDDAGPLHPLAPREALDYFRSLIPLPGIDDPGRWADDHHRVGFTLARQTEEELLKRVQRLLSGSLATGQVTGAEKRLGQILDSAGVTPRSDSYAEMVYRTNMMDAYTQGSMREMQDPDVADYFPVWQYLGIRDGRQGKDHEPHFDRYYPNGVSFAEVRGDRPFNCRCNFRPVDRHEWAELQGRGVTLAKFAEHESFCQVGVNAGRPGPCPESGAPGAKPAKTKAAKPNKKGRPAHHPGAAHGSEVAVKPVKQMAAPRDAKGRVVPVPVKTVLSKQETGRVAEAVIRSYLKTVVGIKDTVALNAGKANESIDLFGDSMAPEVKGGLCNVSEGAQQWRITFSMEMGKKEQEEYAAMSEDQQKAWRETRQRACLERKTALLAKLSKKLGRDIKPVTFTGIVNPDTQTVDIYKTDGYHARIGWNDPKAEHVGSVRYDHA